MPGHHIGVASGLMPLFIVLGKLTDKAIPKMKEVKARDEEAEKNHKTAGGKLIALYYTISRYDFVAIVELPSTLTLAKLVIEIGKWRMVITETMNALLPEQMYEMTKGT